MARPRRDLGQIALYAAFAVLAGTIVVVLLLLRAQQLAQSEIVHTLEVQDRLSRVLTQLQDAETGQRGYLVTHDPQYLQPYFSGTQRIGAELEGLKASVADNAAQVAAAKDLARCARERTERLTVGLEHARNDSFDAAAEAVRSGIGKRIMDRCRAQVAAMKATEASLFDARVARSQSRNGLLNFWLLLNAILVGVLALFVTRRARETAQAAVAARDELARANARLVEESANREAAETQLRQMHKMETIGQLTGGIAHDFNNMLAIVIGSLDLAKRRLAKDRKRAEASIDNAMQGAERAAQLTARLLAFSRQQPLAPSALNANKLVGDMAELLRRTIGESIRFEAVLAGGLWTAFADTGQLENAVVNLCVNARDAMPEGGRLTIETANAHLDEQYAAANSEVVPGQYVMLSVTDTGVGMKPEVVERAFDPFYTTKEVGKGTGLGLSQVYGFVKQSGGHVKIYSEIGIGTTVKLYLPRHFGESSATSAVADADAMPRAGTDEIVLVVEDEERVRQLSVEALRELGYVVLQAEDGESALALLEQQPRVDLLFTDIVMPGMNGRRLAEAARRARPELKVLFTTGYTRNAIVHNGVLDHDVQFIAKPFTISQLAVKVRQVLDMAG